MPSVCKDPLKYIIHIYIYINIHFTESTVKKQACPQMFKQLYRCPTCPNMSGETGSQRTLDVRVMLRSISAGKENAMCSGSFQVQTLGRRLGFAVDGEGLERLTI